ncbi:MAG: GNAT family N-acetyltransferase [Acidimicrobiales bacterium]
MQVVIRDGRPEEAAELEALQRRASLVWDDQRDALLEHPDAISVPASLFDVGDVRVATDPDGRTVGFSVVLPSADDAAPELDGLFVEPALQGGRGIGRALVDDAAQVATGRGRSALWVIANPNALAFYEKVGFVVTGEVATRFGPGLRMRLDLVRSHAQRQAR